MRQTTNVHKVKYCGSLLDYSGYGEANRHDVAALVSAGIDVSTEIPRYTPEIADFGELGELVRSLDGKNNNHNIKILHTTPNVYGMYHEPGKYHVGRVFWETTKLPTDFSDPINKYVDEVWTGSEHNKIAIANSGVKKPIYIIPEAITVPAPNVEPYLIAQKESYKFYSIFEWTERKNPKALLDAYWSEFRAEDNVSLTIKTYVDNFSPHHKQEIAQDVRKVKKRLNYQYHAPLLLYTGLMSRNQIYRFHKSFDCFVSAHRGEGWGIPQMEAMLVGNPIISTNCGGIHDHLTENEAILLPYKLEPLVENSRNRQWYTQEQFWADVDMASLRRWLRWAYENQKEARQLGKRGQNLVKTTFSTTSVGQIMKDRLESIKL